MLPVKALYCGEIAISMYMRVVGPGNGYELHISRSGNKNPHLKVDSNGRTDEYPALCKRRAPDQ
jgi:hypothetical protein